MIFKRSKLNSIKSALAGALVMCLSQTVSALEVAPYFETWASGSLVDAKRNSGLNSATLAFGITNGSCALEGDLLRRLPDARNFMAQGGQLRISFGGASGVYAEIACRDDNQLFALFEKVMLDSGIRRFDFDVEGHQLPNTDATARRARVLARLQAKYPDLYVSMSLPGWLNGFDGNSMNLLRTTVSAGVRIDMVNVMAMSFGVEQVRTMVQPSTVGQAAVVTFRAAANQMTQIFPGRSTSQLHNMMGITPMVGKNDDGSTMTLGDAQTIADFVRNNGVGLIAYWSFQRDRAQSWTGQTPIEQYSGVTQSNSQYHSIFNSAFGWGGAPAATPAPAPTPVTPPVSAAPSSCNAQAWVSGRQYAAGSVVNYNGKTYTAKYANPGYTPTVSTYFWSESACNAAAPAPVAAAPVAAAPVAAQSCQSSDWVSGRQYAAGSIVRYQGNLYRAKFANPGYTPTISTYFWAWHTC